jgi:large subunit ribosomal protein L18
MQAQVDRKAARRRIRYRIRKKVKGTASRPRLAVYRSLKHIYAQAIDDRSGRTLAYASSREKPMRDSLSCGGNLDAAKRVGETIAEKLKGAGIETVVFDRGGFLYHGRVKALGEAIRAAGLKL